MNSYLASQHLHARAPFHRASFVAYALAVICAPACGSSSPPSPQTPPVGADSSSLTALDAADSGETSPPTGREAGIDVPDAPALDAASPNDGAVVASEGSAPLEASAMHDATDDAAVAPGNGAALESVVVPPSGVTTFQTSLARGGAYLLKASGTLSVGGTAVDAEFAGFDATGNGAMDIVAGIDVGVDVGLLEVHPMNHYTVVPSGPGRMKWYGSYRADHTYYMWITGAGAPLTLKLAAPAGSPGQGASGISVSIFELAAPSPATFQPMPGPMPPSPAAPKIGKGALETVYVPVTKTMVHGTVTTDKAAVYLVQASGAAICGGGGLSMGDADYMDWTAAGAGFNDGEAGVDFGLGVDELNVGQGAGVVGGGYGHRLKGWGPFRNDHIYFMLYAGTGNPLSFVYWDSGYGDNSTTQALAVNVFPLP